MADRDALRGRDFLALRDFSGAELEALLDFAARRKAGRDRVRYLDGQTLGLLFASASTRTRISFQVACRRLGAWAEHYTPGELQMSNHETLIDTTEVMSRLLDGIVVRSYNLSAYGEAHRGLRLMAERSTKPVINALDDTEHPCQVMADLLTLRELFGEELPGRRIVFTWAYAKRQKSLGVTHSMLAAAALLGLDLEMVYPEGFDPDPGYLDFAREAAARSGARIRFSHDLEQASEGASVIYAKSWKSLELTVEEDLAQREQLRERWRVSEHHFERARPEAVFMDCMPLIRGDEATAEVVDGPRSVRYQEAENRLWAQEAILASLLT
ncbi:MAG TPA: ornithine carbamoyltransferase [Thermoanaerobaculia bacterium]|nr:ornithine carbamoyltransferase [Thermoanaerobaculia bacterium]